MYHCSYIKTKEKLKFISDLELAWQSTKDMATQHVHITTQIEVNNSMAVNDNLEIDTQLI